MSGMADESIDLIVTDPPYGVEFQSNRREEKFDVIDGDDTLDWFYSFAEQAYRVLSENTALYCFTRFDAYPKMYRELDKFFDVKNLLVIPSKNMSMGDLDATFDNCFELCVFAMKGRRKYNEVKKYRETPSAYWDSRNTDTDGWRYRPPAYLRDFDATVHNSGLDHPTQKSVELMRYWIKLHSDENDVVLDPFCGSGTTCVAAKQTGRNYVGIEKDQKYLELSKERVAKQPERLDAFIKT